MDLRVPILVEHYQKTYELTYDFWKQRNRIFLYLLGVIGIATFISFKILQSKTILVCLAVKAIGLTKDSEIQNFQSNFPYWELMTIFLILIFYLMVNLFHRAIYVLRNYKYLNLLETEIRDLLNLTDTSFAITREGKFYWSERPILFASVKYVYIGFLGILLILFFYKRFEILISESNLIHFCISAIIILPTIVYYFAYAYYSIKLDKK